MKCREALELIDELAEKYPCALGETIRPIIQKMLDETETPIPTDWKEKFEYWLTNNQYINKKTALVIIDHVARYFPPKDQSFNYGYNEQKQDELYQENQKLKRELEEKEQEIQRLKGLIEK